MALTRESIREGYIQRMVAESGAAIQMLSEAELRQSIAATLARRPEAGDVWLFGYGSLIWNPAFHFAERRVGTIHGFHRRFCLWTHLGRGTPERPGLTLGLDRGGACRGVCFRVAAGAVESELDIVWRREMVSGAYAPRWIEVATDAGRLAAIAFVINHAHPRYAGLLPEATVIETIAEAAGHLGPCADYLLNTVTHLDALGIADRPMRRLRQRVVERLKAAGKPWECSEPVPIPEMAPSRHQSDTAKKKPGRS
ncbi:MAG: gamma-glutamylcyclotransferase [Proteobacteria bacterium]|nr:gamma-glutamylcyclotransferase [Pseudomonadota bacterium]MBI3498129.1 gamma-glutamylcyclotransferase [Pseudomonadota bacterium]